MQMQIQIRIVEQPPVGIALLSISPAEEKIKRGYVIAMSGAPKGRANEAIRKDRIAKGKSVFAEKSIDEEYVIPVQTGILHLFFKIDLSPLSWGAREKN